jgi:hypothetical protein
MLQSKNRHNDKNVGRKKKKKKKPNWKLKLKRNKDHIIVR